MEPFDYSRLDGVENDEVPPKMVVITRADMPPGYQLVQSVHAMADFAATHPQVFSDWQRGTNTLVCLSVADEPALTNLWDKLGKYGVPMVQFREPDVQDQLTAFCILGTELIRSKLRYLSPALQGNKNQTIKGLTSPAKSLAV
jgi:hypothetical protein